MSGSWAIATILLLPSTAVVGDERHHQPGPDPAWGEWWYFDFADAAASIGGYVRLGLHPSQHRASWWSALVGHGRPLLLVRDEEVALPRGRHLEVRSSGLWGQLTCETPLEHWSVG